MVSKVEDPEVMVETISEVVIAVAKRVSDPVVEPSLLVRALVVNGRRPLAVPAPEPVAELVVVVMVSVPVTEVLVMSVVAVALAEERTAKNDCQ